MHVHPRAVDAEDRLRHEGRVQAVVHGDLLDDETERRDPVGRRDGVGVLEVDLVLAGRDLVVRRLDLEAHLLERQDDVAPRLFAAVHGRQVEVRALVVRVDDRVAVGVAAEEEELRLRPRHEGVAERRSLVHLLLQGHARAAGEGRAVGVVDVADQPADLLPVVGPRVDGEGVPGRHEVHVGLLDAREPLDRGAVELDLAVERLRELGARDLDVLDDAEDVGELQPHEPDVLRLADLQDLGLGKPGPAASNLRIFAFAILSSVF